MNIICGCTSDVGCVRSGNEDAYGVYETLELKLYVVCDGMGGHAAGEVASQLAVSTIIRACAQESTGGIAERVQMAIATANTAIIARAAQDRAAHGMGTTLVMLAVDADGACYVAHCGDSRCYHWHAATRRLVQLTKDHSRVQELIDAGALTIVEARTSSLKNIVTRALGSAEDWQPAISAPFQPAPGDRLLLCTDGLTDMLTDDDIAARLPQGTPQATAAALTAAANEAGGKDNITVSILAWRLETDLPATTAGQTQPAAAPLPCPRARLLGPALVLVVLLLAAGIPLYLLFEQLNTELAVTEGQRRQLVERNRSIERDLQAAQAELAGHGHELQRRGAQLAELTAQRTRDMHNSRQLLALSDQFSNALARTSAELAGATGRVEALRVLCLQWSNSAVRFEFVLTNAAARIDAQACAPAATALPQPPPAPPATVPATPASPKPEPAPASPAPAAPTDYTDESAMPPS